MKFSTKAAWLTCGVLSTVSLAFAGFRLHTNATFVATAYDLHNPANLIYTETHTEVLSGNKVQELSVVFKDSKQKIIAEKKTNFSKSNLHPDFKMEDKVYGKMESCTKTGNDFTLTFRKDKNSTAKSKTISVPSPAVSDAGFKNILLENFDKLVKGEAVVFNMIVPERFDYYSFRYTKSKVTKIAGRDAIVIKMDSDSFIIRQLVSPMYLTYDLNTRKLIQYEGASVIANEDGDRYEVKIVY